MIASRPFPFRPFLIAAGFAAAIGLTSCEYGPGSVCDCGYAPLGDGGFSGPTVGCGNFAVARQSADSLSILHVRSRGLRFEGDTTVELRLEADTSVIAYIERFAAPQHLNAQVCDDVADDDAPVAVDTLASGFVRMRVFGFSPAVPFRTFRLDVDLREAVFKGVFRIDSVKMDSVLVGWLPG